MRRRPAAGRIESSGKVAGPARSVSAQPLTSVDSGRGFPISTNSSSRAVFAYTRTRRASGCGASEKGAEAGRGRGRSGSASLSAQRGEDARTSAANKAARARTRARTIQRTFPRSIRGRPTGTLRPSERPQWRPFTRSRQAKRTGLVDSVRAEQVPGARTGWRGPRASGRAVPQRGRSRRARDHRRVAGPRRASRHARRSTGRAGPPRVPRTVSRPRRGPANQVRTDLQESRRTGRRLLLPSVRAGHRNPDRAPPGSRGGGGHAGPRRAAGGRVSVLRDPPTRAGPGPARSRGEPSVRRLGAVRGALPVRDLDPPEGPRAGVRDAVRYRRECIRDNPQRRLGSNVSASRRPLVQLLHSHGPAPGVRRDLPLASRDHPSPHGDCRLRTRHRVLHQSGRARGRRIHPERRDPLVRPFAAFGTVTDRLRPWRSYRSLTTTVKLIEWVTEPIVAVTVTVYVPGVVKSEVEIVNVEMAVPFAANITLLGLTETVGHTRTRPDDEIEALRLAVA